jgi:hypothetical protein
MEPHIGIVVARIYVYEIFRKINKILQSHEDIIALEKSFDRIGLISELLERRPSLVKELRKEAEASALKIEAQLKQEEADLLQLLEEKRKEL